MPIPAWWTACSGSWSAASPTGTRRPNQPRGRPHLGAPATRRRSQSFSHRNRVGKIKTNGFSAPPFLRLLETVAQDKFDEQAVGAAGEAEADAEVELPVG